MSSNNEQKEDTKGFSYKGIGIGSAVIICLITSVFNSITSCSSTNQATAQQITELSTKVNAIQSDTSEMKKDLKMLNEKVIQDNQELNNRLIILEYSKQDKKK